MNRLLIVAILAICTVPLYAQGHPPNAAELAQTVFGIIAGDRLRPRPIAKSSISVISSIVPAGTNSNVAIDLPTLCRRSSHGASIATGERREAGEKDAASRRTTD